VYAQNRFAAQRFGCRAELIHPDGSRLAGVPELTEELLRIVEPAAQRLGSLELLAPLRMLAQRTQADVQLELGARCVDAVVVELQARTAASRFAPAAPG
jgi:gamma-glutamyl:cysteine ligase YbdK (ATP-grasp superfamily)